ncbi:MAG: hypothetical protein ACOC10_01910 [Bacteroidota bacterium]
MKKGFYSIFLLSMVILLSCSEEKSTQSDPATECLPGTWEFVEDNFTKSFTFNADHTGIEVQAANDVRNFTWEVKKNKPVIIYVNETNEWEFDLDCEKNELTILFAVYQKK